LHRLTHEFSIYTFIDKTPPEVKIVSDPCNTKFEILSTELLKTDAGISSVEISDVVNGMYSTMKTNSKENFSVFTVTDPRQDA